MTSSSRSLSDAIPTFSPPISMSSYKRPELVAYGTFRDITRIGRTGAMDLASILNNDTTDNNDGCNPKSTSEMTSCRSF